MGAELGHAHGHSHGAPAEADRRWLAAALLLLLVFMLGEVVVAFAARSLALLSDAGHMLSDVAALAAALIAMRLAARSPSDRWTYGLKRAEVLTAAVNGTTMLVVACVVLTEAVRRLTVSDPEVDGAAVLLVALVGCLVNLVTAWLISRADRRSLNVEGAYQHVLTDLYGFLGTVAAAVVILATGWSRADAVASLVVVALMLRAAASLLRESGHILLQGTPDSVDLAEVRAHLLAVDHVLDVHDLHAWTVTSGLPTLSAHVVVDDGCFLDGHVPRLLDEVQGCLGDHFDVAHSTFQFEQAAHASHEQHAHR